MLLGPGRVIAVEVWRRRSFTERDTTEWNLQWFPVGGGDAFVLLRRAEKALRERRDGLKWLLRPGRENGALLTN